MFVEFIAGIGALSSTSFAVLYVLTARRESSLKVKLSVLQTKLDSTEIALEDSRSRNLRLAAALASQKRQIRELEAVFAASADPDAIRARLDKLLSPPSSEGDNGLLSAADAATRDSDPEN